MKGFKLKQEDVFQKREGISIKYGNNSLTLQVEETENNKNNIYNGKKLQKNNRNIGTSVC